ncbi:hypothetical protein CVCC1112_2589 [Paenarthrobacter nicotinovorans]|nr:hypothetical protein CVCC1112_2589 [Paenarthrobacter nicotinovorans]
MEKGRGSRITTLRHLLGLNQTALSGLSGISQSHISLMERGERAVTATAVESIAQATKTPSTFFDVDYAGPWEEISFRKMATTSAVSRDGAIARFNELERLAIQLGVLVSFPEPVLPSAEGDISGDDIERLAAETRSALGLEPNDPVLNLTRSLERRGVVIAPINDSDENLLGGHDGASRPSQSPRRPVIAYVSGKAGDRERFTKAHELGHLVLHSHRSFVLDKIKEREAHRFAGAFLVPAAEMRESVSESLALNGYLVLKAQWGISIAALVTRAHELGIISDSRRKSLMVQISYKGWRKLEPVEVAPEAPLLMRQMLTKGFGPSPYMKAASALGIPPQFLRDWAPGATESSSSLPVIERPGATNVVPLFAPGRNRVSGNAS